MIYLGTSGFNHDEWAGTFYPADLPKHQWLVHYAREFDTCEIDSTYYAIPRSANLRAMALKTGDSFLFGIKANQEMTHRTHDNEPVFSAFVEAIGPLVELRRLGCILAQFPNAFQLNRENWDYLKVLQQRLYPLPVVVEFRNRQWLRDEVFGWLRNLGLGFCCVDDAAAADGQPAAEATGQVSCVRLPGRVSRAGGQASGVRDSSYPKAELARWIPRIRKLESMSDRTFVYADNRAGVQAIGTVRRLKAMLA